MSPQQTTPSTTTSTTTTQPSTTQLSDRCILSILRFLSFHDWLLTTSLVCRRWHLLSHSDLLWRDVFSSGSYEMDSEDDDDESDEDEDDNDNDNHHGTVISHVSSIVDYQRVEALSDEAKMKCLMEGRMGAGVVEPVLYPVVKYGKKKLMRTFRQHYMFHHTHLKCVDVVRLGDREHVLTLFNRYRGRNNLFEFVMHHFLQFILQHLNVDYISDMDTQDLHDHQSPIGKHEVVLAIQLNSLHAICYCLVNVHRRTMTSVVTSNRYPYAYAIRLMVLVSREYEERRRRFETQRDDDLDLGIFVGELMEQFEMFEGSKGGGDSGECWMMRAVGRYEPVPFHDMNIISVHEIQYC